MRARYNLCLDGQIRKVEDMSAMLYEVYKLDLIGFFAVVMLGAFLGVQE
jgi:hypothetical protein